MTERSKDTSYANYRLADGMLVCTLKSELIIDKRTAKHVAKELKSFAKTDLRPVLILIHSNYLLFEKEAISALKDDKNCQDFPAIAVVMDSPISSITGKIAATIMKRKLPFKVFANRIKAKLWLMNYLDDLPGMLSA